VTSGDRATQLASPAFDASVWELWPYLTAGASVHIPDEAGRASAAYLWEWIVSEEITVCFLPTPLAEALIEEVPLEGHVALRALLTGGDKLQRSPRSPLPFALINHYGPTECTVVATRATVVPDPESDTPPPIGRPVANTRAYVLDARLGPVPAGARGELYLGGGGLARGYLGRASLTAERFIPDPFSGEPGGRLYRTGDVARHLADGRLEFVGRADDQVKVRGFRIELGEVEAALLLHEGLERVVVVARGDARGSLRLVAYVVARDGASPPQAEVLRQHLRERLPEYMIPQSFVPLAALPLTPNGKVDRAALPEPDELRREAAGEFVAPRNATEEALSRSWGEVLGLKHVGVHDNFFELGGHSLLATQAMSKLTETFGLELPLRALFESPTVAGLAAAVAAAQAEGAGARLAAPSIRPVSREAFRTRVASRREFELPEALKKGDR
jgi:acyl-coenzyme A synthetase/AMP-(fatty) acid ligase/acyl carrier protein